jgi:hypothetical protein
MWYATAAANGRHTLQKGVWNNWLPRFGFAYQLGSKMTIRGGFGVYTFPWNVDTYASAGLGNAFTSSGNQTDSTGNALSSNNLWYPNLVGDPKAVAGGQTINSWFNVNAFASPTPGTFGNMGRNIVTDRD